MYEAKFQTFDDPSGGAATAPRMTALRAELKRRHLDGIIVPHADRHQSEYLPACEERLAWLTGFSPIAMRNASLRWQIIWCADIRPQRP